MSKFAKIIELEDDNQVLLTYSYNDEEDSDELQIRTDVKGTIAKITLGFSSEAKVLRAMENYNLSRAIDFRNQMIKLLS